MTDQEERMRREGVAAGNKIREEANGVADAVLLAAKAEAASITLINAALKEAQNNPMFIQVKSLEVERARIERWSGNVPNFLMTGGSGDGGGFLPMIQIPESASK